MATDNNNEVLASVTVSPARRWLALAMLGLLGVLLVYFGFAAPPANLLLQLFVIGFGALALGVAAKMHGATVSSVELTAAGLRDSDGTVIAELAQIERVDRGAFAFKPSNGFMLRLARAEGRAWRPGLWWRLGRRVGVGGVTPGNEGKIMAEMIQAMIAERGAS